MKETRGDERRQSNNRDRERNGGCTISTAINAFEHITMKKRRTKRQRLALASLGILLSFLGSVSSLTIARQQRATTIALSGAKPPEVTTTTTSINELNLHYSYSFQRHVVQSKDKMLASFEFLDDAREAYPTATMVPMKEYALIAGGGLEETTAYAMEGDVRVDKSLVDSIFQAMPLEENVAEAMKESLPLSRWAGFTPERIRSNFQQLDLMLERKLQLNSAAVATVKNFPHVLLYDPRLVVERLDFLLAPLPPDVGNDSDWALLASQGFGAGWTIEQLRLALQAVPHVVLAMHLEDAFAMRPSLFYFLSVLQVSYHDVDQVRLKLDEWGDIYSFAYLHGIVGLDWLQLSVMLQAFPCLAVCDTEPTWEMMGPDVRSVLKEDALHYLQRRLQVGPNTIEAMIKTHPRLSAYSVEGNIQPTLNALQSKLGLSSRELRKVILRMPSLIGMSVAESLDRGLTQRLKFFYDEGTSKVEHFLFEMFCQVLTYQYLICPVGMTQTELHKAVLKQPSLLQYSVEKSLRLKLDFFVDEVCVPRTEMARVISKYPSLFGLSLEETLRPTVASLAKRCDFSPKELGSVVSRAPNILGLSLRRNLEPTYEYLLDRLGLSKLQLKKLICTTPRVLLHSVKSSLEPKMRMIEAALGDSNQKVSPREAIEVVIQNPALLVTTIAGLQQRLQSGLSSDSMNRSTSVKKVLQPRSKGLTRRKRQVLETNPFTDEVIREYSSASMAAKELGTTLPNMYNLCKTGRLWKGKKFVYGESRLPETAIDTSLPSPTTESQERHGKAKPLEFKDLEIAPLLASGSPRSDTNSTLRIVVHASGRVYPPDATNQVRGTRRAGGMVLYFPQVNDQHCPELAMRLRHAAERSFGQIMPTTENGEGTCYTEGRILIGFPYLRPSRNRCELYACHDALKVVGQLLKHESSLVPLENKTVQVHVYTDSDYAWMLLHNTSRLHAWGATVNEKDFIYDGPGPVWRANPDLLHPLCRTYFRLVEQQDTDGTAMVFGRQVNVTFHHATGSMTSLHTYAKQAAMWMDQRAKTAIKL